MKNFFTIPKYYNESGFSLVEVLVASGMLGVISLGTMSVMDNMTKNQGYSVMRERRFENIRKVRGALQDLDACKRSVGAVPFGTNTLADGDDLVLTDIWRSIAANSEVASTSVTSGPNGDGRGMHFLGITNRLDITSIVLNDWSDVGAPYAFTLNPVGPVIENRQQGNATLTITYTKAGNTATNTYGNMTSEEEVQLVLVRRVADNVLLECASDEESFVTASCASIGGDYTAPPFCTNITIRTNDPAIPSITTVGDIATQFNGMMNVADLTAIGLILSHASHCSNTRHTAQ